ncbi:MAG: galactose oxidase, partial [Planctomycetes bacterium]|nr:galactose oxidase [Planctomycetota bacterium]
MNPIVLHVCRCFVWLLPLFAGCGGGGGGGGGVGVPSASLRAEPDAFAPGATVTLRPVFGAGSGRIDPGVGPVVSGGAYVVGPVVADTTFTLAVTTASGTASAIVVVPVRYRERVLEAPPSPIARTGHGGALLPDGRVLLVAGSSPGALNWTNTETFRGADASFAPAGELSTGRSGVAVAAMTDGTVFACGGNTNSASFEVATRLEQWDPAAVAWSVRANLACNRSGHTLTPLAGGRLLVFGGVALGGSPSDKDAELFEPGSGMRAPIGQTSAHRTGHAAVLRSDGTVLILGGVRVET